MLLLAEVLNADSVLVNAVDAINADSPAGEFGSIEPGDFLISVGAQNVETAEVCCLLSVCLYTHPAVSVTA